MSDSAHPTFRKINYTPLRDLVRFRVSGRLDWRSRLAAANLPKSAADLICRVVKRTRLWPLERVAVADELIAHFADGVAAGGNAGQLIESFGDERVAAKLIRRAKRRGRPWPWHVWNVSIRVMPVVMAVLLAVYAVLLIRFCIGQPMPSVDYLAQVNEPIARVTEADRAWPLWRKSILQCTESANGGRRFSEAVVGSWGELPAWPEAVKWLDAHGAGVEVAREAGLKPAMGLILKPGAPDPLESEVHVRGQDCREFLFDIHSDPYLWDLSNMARVLSLDARLGAERNEPARVEADLISMLGLGRQLQGSDGVLDTQLFAYDVDRRALDRLRFILFNHSSVLTDEQLIDLAHRLSRPRVAADLIDLKVEREAFADVIQRSYTDNGHKDGHLTLAGLRLANKLNGIGNGGAVVEVGAASVSAACILTASRADVMTQYNRLMDQKEADFRLPVRQVDVHGVPSQIAAMANSPIGRIRFAALVDFMPGLSHLQAICELYLGERDGVVVGISLELYRRHHGHYPSSLSELTSNLLPDVPADRITGDPVKYRLIDGKPLVYSVGADRVDDGGRPATALDPWRRNETAATWGVDPKDAPRGDWLLFSSDTPDPGCK